MDPILKKKIDDAWADKLGNFLKKNSNEIHLVNFFRWNHNFSWKYVDIIPKKSDTKYAEYEIRELWDYLSFNEMTLEFFLEHHDLPWNMYIISMYQKFVTLEVVEKNPHVQWSKKGIIVNNNIPLKSMLDTFDIIKYSRGISSREDITLDIPRKYPNGDWVWFDILNTCKIKSLDFMMAEDVNCGWNICKILECLHLNMYDLYEKYPKETEKYCQDHGIFFDESLCELDTFEKFLLRKPQHNFTTYRFITEKKKNAESVTKEFYDECFKEHKKLFQPVLNEIKYTVFLKPENIEFSRLLGLNLIPTENEWHAKMG